MENLTINYETIKALWHAALDSAGWPDYTIEEVLDPGSMHRSVISSV